MDILNAFELDHLFFCSEIGAPEAEYLRDFGLTEGPANAAPRPGTANRRFFFHNAMFELLWVHAAVAAQNRARVRPNCGSAGRVVVGTPHPLGFVCGLSTPSQDLPFSARTYEPAYLPAPRVVRIGENTAIIAEPMLLYLVFGQRPDTGGL